MRPPKKPFAAFVNSGVMWKGAPPAGAGMVGEADVDAGYFQSSLRVI
ncbi:MAG: hypothetical protein ABSB66_11995 [Candidatus Acidiferrales bacterium]